MPDQTVTIAIVAQNLASAELRAATADGQRLAASIGATAGAAGGAAKAVEGAAGGGGLSPVLGRLGFAAGVGEGGVRRLSSGLAFMAVSSLGVEGPLARLTEGLLIFGGGHGVILVAAAAVLAFVAAQKLLGEGHSEEEEKLKKLEDQLHKTFESSRPTWERYAITMGTLTAGVESARDAHLKATLALAQYREELKSATTGENDHEVLQTLIDRATKAQADSQDKLNKALHAQGEARGELLKHARETIDHLKLEAESVGKTTIEQLALRLEMEHMDPVLIRQALHWQALKEHREALAKLAAFEASIGPQQFGAAAAVPGEGELGRMDRFIAQQKEVRAEREKWFKLQADQAAAAARGEGPMQTSLGADTAAGEPPPTMKPDFWQRLGESMLKSFGQGTQGVQTMDIALGNLLAGTLTSMGNAFATMFETIISGSGNAGKAFTKAMLESVKAIALHEGALSLAEGFRYLAMSLIGHPAAPGATAAAFKSAALFFALAGAAGAAAGGGGGGGAAGGGALGAVGMTTAQGATKGSATVIIKGSHATDYAFVDSIAAAFKELQDRNVIVVADPSEA